MKAQYICPMLTSFNEDGTVAYDDMQAFIDWEISNGISGLLLGGSSGEFYALTFEQMKELIEKAVKMVDGRVPLLVGTGSPILENTVALSRFAFEQGASAIMVVGPYYSAATREGVLAYYDAVLSAVDGPVYIYNYPDRTGHDVTDDMALELRQRHENLKGIKDTLPVLRHTQKLVQTVKSQFLDFEVYTGYDNNCIPLLLSGGNGCIGALSNVIPQVSSQICAAFDAGNLTKLMELQRTIDGCFGFYEQPMPFNSIMKWALKKLGVPFKENCKTPLLPLTAAEKRKLKEVVDKVTALK